MNQDLPQIPDRDRADIDQLVEMIRLRIQSIYIRGYLQGQIDDGEKEVAKLRQAIGL